MGRNVGFAVANSSVRADVTGEAVKEFLHEFKRMREGDVSAEEAGKARETLRTDVIQSFAGLGGVLGEAAGRVVAGVPFDTLGRDMEAMQSTGAEQLNGLAKKALPLENGVLVLVGDKNQFFSRSKEPFPRRSKWMCRAIDLVRNQRANGSTLGWARAEAHGLVKKRDIVGVLRLAETQ